MAARLIAYMRVAMPARSPVLPEEAAYMQIPTRRRGATAQQAPVRRVPPVIYAAVVPCATRCYAMSGVRRCYPPYSALRGSMSARRVCYAQR